MTINQITLTEYRPNGSIARYAVTKQSFIKTVDSIRSRKNGWQLTINGRIVSEKEAFGQSVCYGVFGPSFFNS